MDHHVPRAITNSLRLRNVDVVTAYEDGMSRASDSDLLNRATEYRRVLFSRDDDLLSEAARRQRESIPFAGVVYAHQLQVSVGRCIEDLEAIAKASDPKDHKNHVTFLPL